MLLVGLTGSSGMGKSTTAKLFAEAGVPVYDADATVHMLYEGEAVPAIEAAFPGTTADGKVDRNKLSARVVYDPAAIRQLERIVHPMLGASRQKFLDDAERSGAPASTRCGATGWLKSAVSRFSTACRPGRPFTGISIRNATCRQRP